jgi:4-hydroxy-tetrahydrodipicolinate synthase
MFEDIQGVFAAALTPLNQDYSIDFTGFPRLLDFLAGRGCHGALLFGTTGEGPSFSPDERIRAWQVASDWRRAHPDFRLLAGTGTPSLQETIELTQAAFDAGMDGVVTLPPYYFRKVNDEGLYLWFEQVINQAIPPGKAFLGYHFPNVSGVPLSADLLSRLKEHYPDKFAGIKDSSGDPEFARALGEFFGPGLVVLTGNDRLFNHALSNQAAGCITAMANLYSPDLRLVWDAFQEGDTASVNTIQERISAVRAILERYPPFPSLLKALLANQYEFPRWSVRPPLLPMPDDASAQAISELNSTERLSEELEK